MAYSIEQSPGFGSVKVHVVKDFNNHCTVRKKGFGKSRCYSNVTYFVGRLLFVQVDCKSCADGSFIYYM